MVQLWKYIQSLSYFIAAYKERLFGINKEREHNQYQAVTKKN